MIRRNGAKRFQQTVALAATAVILASGDVESVRAAAHGRSATTAQKLIYSSYDCTSPDCNYEIFTLTLDGSAPERLLDAPATDDTYATYSPDGNEIAYIGWDEFGMTADVWLMNADGSDPHVITTEPGMWDETLDWDKHGRIAMARWPELGSQHGDLYMLVRDPSGVWAEELFIGRPGTEQFPTFSPTGHRIAYSYDPDDDGIHSEGESGYSDIWTSRADGRRHERLTHTPRVDEGFPTWAPDGRRIAFARGDIAGDVEPRGHAQIWVMHADGTNKKRLTPRGYLDVHPAWSPDGKRIAFTRCIDKPDHYDCSLAIVALRAPQRIRIVVDRGFEIMPKWIPSPAG